MPWHVPMHRPEGAAAARGARAASATAAAAAAAATAAAPSDDDASRAPTGRDGAVNSEKRAVVFTRFVHLFRRGELTALVASDPRFAVLSEAFDADNWVVLAERNDVA